MSQVILVLVCFATAFTLSSAILIDVLNGHPSFASVTITINQETCTAPFGDICKIGELPAGLVNVTVFDGSGNILRQGNHTLEESAKTLLIAVVAKAAGSADIGIAYILDDDVSGTITAGNFFLGSVCNFATATKLSVQLDSIFAAYDLGYSQSYKQGKFFPFFVTAFLTTFARFSLQCWRS